jgi:hypothetical protein
MADRSYAGGAVAAALVAPITDTGSSITCDALTGWPTGAEGPFAAVLSPGTVDEEKILVATRTGNALTVSLRGYDGTTAKAHDVDAVIEHVITAIDVEEPNRHINDSVGVHGLAAQEQVVGTDKAQTLINKTLDGDDNTFTNIPLAASPEIIAEIADVQAEVDAEEVARAAGDADRYTKAEADARFTTDAEADVIADASSSAAVAAHAGAADPHSQYLTQAEGDAAFLTQAEGDARYPLDANLTGFTKMHVGYGAFTPNANGRVVVPHGAPFDPDFMLFTVADTSGGLDATGGKVVNPESGSSDQNSVAVRVYRNDNGNPVTSQIGLRWAAFRA